jgi:hypothetical protein
MNSMSNIIGIVLIVFGVVSLGYKGYSYTTQEKVAEVGPIKVTADTEKTVLFSPIAGGICLVAGLGLIIIGRMKK